MSKLFAAAAGFCLLGLVAVTSTAGPTTAPSTTQPSTQPSEKDAKEMKFTNKNCAVNQTEEIDKKTYYIYEGKKIGFCCPDCIDDFKKEPQKYLATMK